MAVKSTWCAVRSAWAQMHTADGVIRRIAELVAVGELGTVTAVRIVYGCWLPRTWSPDGNPHDNWRFTPACELARVSDPAVLLYHGHIKGAGSGAAAAGDGAV